MEIFTSYHARAEKLVEMGLTLISISVMFPWYSKIKYESYLSLAPRKDMLKMDKESYGIEFEKILKQLDSVKVYSQLSELSNGKDVVLLCYEKDRDECHRKMIGEWLEKKLQINVKEVVFNPEKKKMEKGLNQLGLFG